MSASKTATYCGMQKGSYGEKEKSRESKAKNKISCLKLKEIMEK